jgi:cell shape-determining protein MreC
LLSSMEFAIDNMIQEIRKPVDQELSGSQRKAELQSIKQTAVDAKELIQERQRLEEMIKTLKETGGINEEQDFSGGFAERFSKK